MRCREELEEDGPVVHVNYNFCLDFADGSVVEKFGQSLKLDLLQLIEEGSDVDQDALSHINTPTISLVCRLV